MDLYFTNGLLQIRCIPLTRTLKLTIINLWNASYWYLVKRVKFRLSRFAAKNFSYPSCYFDIIPFTFSFTPFQKNIENTKFNLRRTFRFIIFLTMCGRKVSVKRCFGKIYIAIIYCLKVRKEKELIWGRLKKKKNGETELYEPVSHLD